MLCFNESKVEVQAGGAGHNQWQIQYNVFNEQQQQQHHQYPRDAAAGGAVGGLPVVPNVPLPVPQPHPGLFGTATAAHRNIPPNVPPPLHHHNNDQPLNLVVNNPLPIQRPQPANFFGDLLANDIDIATLREQRQMEDNFRRERERMTHQRQERTRDYVNHQENERQRIRREMRDKYLRRHRHKSTSHRRWHSKAVIPNDSSSAAKTISVGEAGSSSGRREANAAGSASGNNGSTPALNVPGTSAPLLRLVLKPSTIEDRLKQRKEQDDPNPPKN